MMPSALSDPSDVYIGHSAVLQFCLYVNSCCVLVCPAGYPPLPSSLYSSPYLSLGHLDPPPLSQHPLYDSHKGQSLPSTAGGGGVVVNFTLTTPPHAHNYTPCCLCCDECIYFDMCVPVFFLSFSHVKMSLDRRHFFILPFKLFPVVRSCVH